MVDLIYSSNTLFTDEKGMKSSFLINDQGVLSIYADHFFYKGRDIEISVEKSRIKETSVINKSVGNCGKSYIGIRVYELFRKEYTPSCIVDYFGKSNTVFSDFS